MADREPELREPAFDLDFEGDPDTDWNRLALGWLSEPVEHPVRDEHLLVVMWAEAITLAEFMRWLDLW